MTHIPFVTQTFSLLVLRILTWCSTTELHTHGQCLNVLVPFVVEFDLLVNTECAHIYSIKNLHISQNLQLENIPRANSSLFRSKPALLLQCSQLHGFALDTTEYPSEGLIQSLGREI